MSKICTVLIAEDDKEDAEFLRNALKDVLFKGNIEHFPNGLQLMEKLTLLKKNGNLPEMIILDLNMPRGTQTLLEVWNGRIYILAHHHPNGRLQDE